MGSAAPNITGYTLYNIYVANIWLQMENKDSQLSLLTHHCDKTTELDRINKK